jgi:hypothetical protein
MKRNLWVLAVLAIGVFAGHFLSSGTDGGVLAPTPAQAANDGLFVADGQTLVSTEEGNAYLWRRVGDRIELVGQCARTTDSLEQATFVWMPGVERGS